MNQNLNGFYQLLGLSLKAGKLVIGEMLCQKAIRMRKAQLVIISEEASPNTLKKFVNLCRYYKTECVVVGSKEMLGRAVGKGSRTVLAVTDQGLKEALLKQLQTQKCQCGGGR